MVCHASWARQCDWVGWFATWGGPSYPGRPLHVEQAMRLIGKYSCGWGAKSTCAHQTLSGRSVHVEACWGTYGEALVGLRGFAYAVRTKCGQRVSMVSTTV